MYLHTIYQKKAREGMINKIKFPFQTNLSLEKIIYDLDLEIPKESTLYVVNGKIEEPGYIVAEGDEIHFIPAISGGSSSI